MSGATSDGYFGFLCILAASGTQSTFWFDAQACDQRIVRPLHHLPHLDCLASQASCAPSAQLTSAPMITMWTGQCPENRRQTFAGRRYTQTFANMSVFGPSSHLHLWIKKRFQAACSTRLLAQPWCFPARWRQGNQVIFLLFDGSWVLELL